MWFGHDPTKWPEFRRRYGWELRGDSGEVERLRARIATARGPVAFVFAAKDEEHNAAAVLKDYRERTSPKS